MIYDIKVLKRAGFITSEQYQEAIEKLINDEGNDSDGGYYIVSHDEYDDDFMVFAKELE